MTPRRSKQTIGMRLKAARRIAGISSEVVAERLDIAYPTLNKYENDHRIPGADLIVKLADLYQCDVRSLLEDPHYLPGLPVIENPIPIAGKIIDSENFTLSFEGPHRNFLPMPSSDPGHIFALEVMSNSLNGVAYKGEFIIIKKEEGRDRLEITDGAFEIQKQRGFGKIIGIFRHPRTEKQED